MAGTRRAARQNATNIYDDMLAEVNAQQPEVSERPLKRRRRDPAPEPELEPEKKDDDAFEKWLEDEDEDLVFEDVLPDMTVQTMERDSDEEDEDEDDEDGAFMEKLNQAGGSKSDGGDLQLDLAATKAALTPSKKAAERRKPLTREEKERRMQTHQVHLLCLLSYVHRRNHWCNDGKVQEALSKHLTDKMIGWLNPSTRLSQFGREQSLKKGLEELGKMWKTKFEIIERGSTRALWAEDPELLYGYQPPDDMDSCLDRDDFRAAAKTLQGSRDVGAQLFCALLRRAGVRARLVCSLQPLACISGAPAMSKSRDGKSAVSSNREQALASIATQQKNAQAAREEVEAQVGRSTARRRLGHPGAASYDFQPQRTAKESKPVFQTKKRIRESAYPVYWVEVLDAGHQKWQPVDAVVTHTFWQPKVFEPPIGDKDNSMSYVVAFDADGTAKDVTRRYAKAYTAKTRKARIDTVLDGGDKWWCKTMKNFKSKYTDDLDEIEDNELAGAEAREPMPKNVQDFKDHPIYALERHLRRHEVLLPDATPSGTIGAGSKGPLEKIYRRKHVRTGRTSDKWYRLGRVVKNLEIPVKWLPKKAKRRGRLWDEDDEEEEDDGVAGTPLYTIDQTELYESAPVRDGKVPKNKFGNIDVYVPSMVPPGGVHINHERARHAAHIVGVDYAPALTGFSFNGRQGTAVLSGVVVALEHEAAVNAVIEGLADLEQELQDERRRVRALRMWRRMLMSLRIREQVWGGVDPEVRKEAERDADMAADMEEAEAAESDVTEEYDMEVDDEDDDYGGGGFMADDDGGGFIP